MVPLHKGASVLTFDLLESLVSPCSYLIANCIQSLLMQLTVKNGATASQGEELSHSRNLTSLHQSQFSFACSINVGLNLPPWSHSPDLALTECVVAPPFFPDGECRIGMREMLDTVRIAMPLLSNSNLYRSQHAKALPHKARCSRFVDPVLPSFAPLLNLPHLYFLRRGPCGPIIVTMAEVFTRTSPPGDSVQPNWQSVFCLSSQTKLNQPQFVTSPGQSQWLRLQIQQQ